MLSKGSQDKHAMSIKSSTTELLTGLPLLKQTSSKRWMVDYRDTVQLAAVGTPVYQHQVS